MTRDDRAIGTDRLVSNATDVAIAELASRTIGAITPRIVRAASGIAATAVLVALVLRVVRNAGGLPATLDSVYPVAATVAFLGPALTAVLAGVATPDVRVRAGLVSAGVFGCLAAIVPAATVPAAGAVVAGGALALYATPAATRRGRFPMAPVLAGGGLLCGAGIALATGLGLLAADVRSLGTVLALCGLAATPLLIEPPRGAWIAGGLAGIGVFLAGTVAPFVTGAVTLVAWAVVDASLVLVAAGVAGAVVTTVAGLARLENRNASVAFGGLLLLGAGVPATVPRALATVLGLWLLAESRRHPSLGGRADE